MPRVLNLLSQRPSLTGSGVTLDALVRHAAAAGWEQRVVVGVPDDDAAPAVGGLKPEHIFPLRFAAAARSGAAERAGRARLDFSVPGMSDVMPYPSTRFRDMTPEHFDAYRFAWKDHVRRVIDAFEPDVIHSHHVWILSSLVKDVCGRTPVVVHCHATGLRQMAFCPHLAADVRAGCRRNERFAVLHGGHAAELAAALGIEAERVHIVGAGYRDDLFHARGRAPGGGASGARVLYAGKYSASKGLPWLLDAVERLASRLPGLELHVAGSGAGPEAEALERRMRDLAPLVRLHGQLPQQGLARLMRDCSVLALPSFYEGLPLVLIEALACGCRLVATALPGVVDQLAPHLGGALALVPLPRLRGVDEPEAADLPRFVAELESAIAESVRRGPILDPAKSHPGTLLEPFAWQAVFERVERIWRELLRG